MTFIFCLLTRVLGCCPGDLHIFLLHVFSLGCCPGDHHIFCVTTCVLSRLLSGRPSHFLTTRGEVLSFGDALSQLLWAARIKPFKGSLLNWMTTSDINVQWMFTVAAPWEPHSLCKPLLKDLYLCCSMHHSCICEYFISVSTLTELFIINPLRPCGSAHIMSNPFVLSSL